MERGEEHEAAREGRRGARGRGGAGPAGQGLDVPVAGMLMDRVTRLLGPARGGEGIFLEGRVSEFGIGSGGRARGHQKFLLHLGFRLDSDPVKGAVPASRWVPHGPSNAL